MKKGVAINEASDKRCIESKALKLYMFSFRNHQGFAEKIVNRMLDDVVGACQPKQAAVCGFFTPRGGISIKVEAKYERNK